MTTLNPVMGHDPVPEGFNPFDSPDPVEYEGELDIHSSDGDWYIKFNEVPQTLCEVIISVNNQGELEVGCGSSSNCPTGKSCKVKVEGGDGNAGIYSCECRVT